MPNFLHNNWFHVGEWTIRQRLKALHAWHAEWLQGYSTNLQFVSVKKHLDKTGAQIPGFRLFEMKISQCLLQNTLAVTGYK